MRKEAIKLASKKNLERVKSRLQHLTKRVDKMQFVILRLKELCGFLRDLGTLVFLLCLARPDGEIFGWKLSRR